jgi:uncharacterized protein (DUF433 family)
MVASITNLLGVGIYTPAEAAHYARVRTQLLTRWFHGKGGRAVITPQLGSERRFVTFLDFVQALAIRAIRTKHEVSLETITAAYEEAQRLYGVAYPFAMRHKTFLFGELGRNKRDPERPHSHSRKKRRQEIVIEVEGRLHQLSGKEHGNQMFATVAELYLQDLTFDSEGYADSYIAFRLGDQRVVMDPHRRFGEPIIESCGYTASALFDSYLAEGSVESASRAYGVKTEEIELAIRYFDFLQRPAAA